MAAIEALCWRFDAHLRSAGFVAMRGQIVDATVVVCQSSGTPIRTTQILREGRASEDGAEDDETAAEGGTAMPAGR